MKLFEIFKCLSQNLSNSLCQFWNDKSIPLQILHPSSVSWKITPLYFFKSNNIYFPQKEPINMKIFGTFKCLGQNSSSSSCQFWNDKSVPLQILRNSSLSRQIILLLILRIASKSQFWVLYKKFAIFLMSFSKPQVNWK